MPWILGVLSPNDKAKEDQRSVKTPTMLIPPNSLEIAQNQSLEPSRNAMLGENSAMQNGKSQNHAGASSSPSSTPTTATTSTSASMNDSTPLYALSQQSLDTHSPEDVKEPEPKSFFSLVPVRYV